MCDACERYEELLAELQAVRAGEKPMTPELLDRMIDSTRYDFDVHVDETGESGWVGA